MNEERLKATCPPCFTLEQWAHWEHAYAACGGTTPTEDYCEDCTPQRQAKCARNGSCIHAVSFVKDDCGTVGVRVS